jgi:signal transduction histidine kinase
MTAPLPTDFLPVERASQPSVLHQSHRFVNAPLVLELLNAVPGIVLVLNQQRQIVFSNRALLEVLGVSEEAVIGLRPGEALNCVHAREPGCGCGTTEFCRTCGAAQAILSGLGGQRAVNECRIVQQNGTALDLRVRVTPLSVNGEAFLAFAAEDISHEKRRQVLERLFFHDLLNLAGVIQGYAALLSDPRGPDQAARITENLFEAARRLIEEIEAQRELSAAENGDLLVRPSALRSLDLLQGVRVLYEAHDAARDRRIAIADRADDVRFTSDRALLERVIGNMVKNALEASAPGQMVTLSCRADDQRVVFEVHNPAFMPREVQLQIFQRSFSTKGSGRGLGTYSMKLLSERYLHGAVAFTTSPEHGTTFSATYPLILDTP